MSCLTTMKIIPEKGKREKKQKKKKEKRKRTAFTAHRLDIVKAEPIKILL